MIYIIIGMILGLVISEIVIWVISDDAYLWNMRRKDRKMHRRWEREKRR